MPAGPKGEKRPADVIGNAVKVMRTIRKRETCHRQCRTYCRGCHFVRQCVLPLIVLPIPVIPMREVHAG
jgi:hypothetical protein